MDPVFLRLDHVLTIHAEQIERYGGSPGIRDRGILESALAAPSATFGGSFLLGDLSGMAASYAYGLANNHPFVDGNKRVAANSAIVFLYVNGWKFEMDPDDFAELILKVASGRADRTMLTEAFRVHSKKR